jgi:curved DNA-binding protein
MSDHYTTLGVNRNSTPDEIKKAYRRLASQHHPDKGGETARFQQIQTAYDVLSDARQRAAYDQPPPQPGPGGFHFDFGGPSMQDIFQQHFGGASPFAARRPAHVRVTVWIGMQEVMQGGNRTINVSAQGGSTTVNVSVPPGLEDGNNVQYSGVGPNGLDLVVQYRIHADPRWQRHDHNLLTDQPVSIWHLIQGGPLKVFDVVNNELEISIPPRTKPGTVMRLRGRGVPHQHGGAGDILLRITASIPDDIPEPVLDAIRQHC